MSPLKKGLLIFLVVASLLMSGVGGISDMLGIQTWRVTSAHAWSDSHLLMMLAILVALTLK